MTFTEKTNLFHGSCNGYTGNVCANTRLGIPEIKMNDGPREFPKTPRPSTVVRVTFVLWHLYRRDQPTALLLPPRHHLASPHTHRRVTQTGTGTALLPFSAGVSGLDSSSVSLTSPHTPHNPHPHGSPEGFRGPASTSTAFPAAITIAAAWDVNITRAWVRQLRNRLTAPCCDLYAVTVL